MNDRTLYNLFTMLFALLSALGAVAVPQVTFAQTTEDRHAATVAQLQERGYLVVGVKYDAPPFGFLNDEGNLVGFEIDLVRAMAATWGLMEDQLIFEQVTSATRIDKLLNGEIDLIAATMTHTPSRAEQIAFSQTYFLDGQTALVRAAAGINTWADLAGKRVGAITGSTSLERLIAYSAEHELTIQIVEFEEYTDAVARLADGVIDGVTTDRGILAYFATIDPTVTLLEEAPISEEPYGLGIQPGNPEFVALIDFTLQRLQDDGTYALLYAKWFPDESIAPEQSTAPANATTTSTSPTGTSPAAEDIATIPVYYTVAPGDNLYTLALRFYGQGMRYHEIYLANQAVIGDNPRLIHPGQVLLIP